MRIAYLINRYPKVSHSFIRREILALERQGIEVVRISVRGWDDTLVDEDDISECARTRYVLRDGGPALAMALARMAFVRPLRFMRALALAWFMSRRAERPLPVHLIYLAEACRIEPWLRAARVRHVHAHFGTNPAEVAMLVHVLGGPNWSFTVHGPEEFDKAPLIGLAEKVRRCAFVVAVCSYGRSQLYRLVDHRHWPKVIVAHCGLEPSLIDAVVGPPPDARRLVCVGRLCEYKGQLLLLEAARELAAQDLEFELVLVGDGELRSDLAALIVRYKLQRHVRITGWLSFDQVRNEIQAARALVLPSFGEGLPMVIMEAMALGRPVISTFVAGIPELVHRGEHGWLVPAGDLRALTTAIKNCLDTNPEVLQRMGTAARERTLRRHNVDIEVSRLATLFREAAAQIQERTKDCGDVESTRPS
jgi:glycosyltransferase involved in cell wall biosynthesis